MDRKAVFLFCLFCIFGFKCFATEIDYNTCYSLEEIIAKETTKIDNASDTDSLELAHLYVSRGESYVKVIF